MVFYNQDWIMFFLTRTKEEMTEEHIRDYIRSLGGTQVTDFSINVNGTTSAPESEILESFSSRYLRTEENGVPVNYKNTALENPYVLKQKGIDMYAIWIDELRRQKIRPWLSFRMNDVHGNMEKTEYRKASFVEEHSELWVDRHKKEKDYFSRCFDYAKQEVRERMLAYMNEQLSRYDIDGVELDFMREIYLFRLGYEAEGRSIMTAYIREIRAMIDRFEEKWGHKIELSLILPPRAETAYERGIDVPALADIVDYITIIGRWDTTDTDMPIELWHQLLRGTNVKIGCGQQLMTKCFYSGKYTVTSVSAAFGEACGNLSRGSDFVYLYNYMDRMAGFDEFSYTASDIGAICNDELRPLIFGNIGSLDTLVKQKRRHVLTFCDTIGFVAWRNEKLPRHFDGTNLYRPPFKINVGVLPEKRKLTLVLGFDREIDLDKAEIYVNGANCVYDGRLQIEPYAYERPCYTFDFDAKIADTAIVEVQLFEVASLEYMEIRVTPLD